MHRCCFVVNEKLEKIDNLWASRFTTEPRNEFIATSPMLRGEPTRLKWKIRTAGNWEASAN